MNASILPSSPALPRPPLWRVAWQAIRPRTLGLSVAPVLLGSSLAWNEGAAMQVLNFIAAMLASILIQIATNLHNDAVDYEKGNDRADRPGPVRVTAAGWVSSQAMRQWAFIAFGGAFLIGIYLVWAGGWPIALIGLASLFAGWSYSGGPRPIAYSPFGEGFVLVFFGLLAVAGSAWLQGVAPGLSTILTGCVVGFPAAAVLLVNNNRDRVADSRVGRRTLAIVLGPLRTSYLYVFLVAGVFCFLPALIALGYSGAACGGLAIPVAVRLIREFLRANMAGDFNPLLAKTARLGSLLAALVSLGFLLF